MSKSTPKRTTPTPIVKPNPQVERAIKKVQQFYNWGKQSVTDHPGRAKDGTKSGPEKASMYEKLRKARQFAELFTRKDLTEIFTLCREHAFPFQVNHVTPTFSLKTDRMAFIRNAIAQGWSVRDLKIGLFGKIRG